MHPYGYLYYIVKVEAVDGDVRTANVWYNKITEPIAIYFIRPLYALLWDFLELFVEMPESGPMFLIKVSDEQKKAFHEAAGGPCGNCKN